MFEVKKNKCDQCLFSPNKIVSDERKKEILEGCAINDNHFTCHKATIEDQDHCCKGFCDSQSSNMIRISKRLGMVKFVD